MWTSATDQQLSSALRVAIEHLARLLSLSRPGGRNCLRVVTPPCRRVPPTGSTRPRQRRTPGSSSAARSDAGAPNQRKAAAALPAAGFHNRDEHARRRAASDAVLGETRRLCLPLAPAESFRPPVRAGRRTSVAAGPGGCCGAASRPRVDAARSVVFMTARSWDGGTRSVGGVGRVRSVGTRGHAAAGSVQSGCGCCRRWTAARGFPRTADDVGGWSARPG